MARECEVVNPDARSGWFPSLTGWWSSSSIVMLRAVEKRILSSLKTTYRGWYVDIGPVVGKADKIWTISLNEDSPKTPLLLLHGLGSGVALWVLNLDSLAASRPIYAIDLLGFGRSSRPAFSSDAEIAERQLVNSVEEWRKEMNVEKFYLLGHSMGGFIATSYSMKYPERVKHLILADPWGFPEKPSNVSEVYNLPIWVRAVGAALQPFNPLWALRAAGPFGQWVVQKARPDIGRKFNSSVQEAEAIIPQYIHQCNAQDPSGESAFHTMMDGFGWAKNPMLKRIDQLNAKIPITMLYGSRSWIDNIAGDNIKNRRPKSYVNVQIINGAGHHVYLDKPEIFNKHVLEACKFADNQDDETPEEVEDNVGGKKILDSPPEADRRLK